MFEPGQPRRCAPQSAWVEWLTAALDSKPSRGRGEESLRSDLHSGGPLELDGAWPARAKGSELADIYAARYRVELARRQAGKTLWQGFRSLLAGLDMVLRPQGGDPHDLGPRRPLREIGRAHV